MRVWRVIHWNQNPEPDVTGPRLSILGRRAARARSLPSLPLPLTRCDGGSATGDQYFPLRRGAASCRQLLGPRTEDSRAHSRGAHDQRLPVALTPQVSGRLLRVL